MGLNFFVIWFTDLKNDGVSENDILDVLEFDSDVYPDYELMKQAKRIVYQNETF